MEWKPCDPFTFHKVENGFVLHEERCISSPFCRNQQFVFRNTEELCEWIKDYYKGMEKPVPSNTHNT